MELEAVIDVSFNWRRAKTDCRECTACGERIYSEMITQMVCVNDRMSEDAIEGNSFCESCFTEMHKD